jgi:hypothetical protein
LHDILHPVRRAQSRILSSMRVKYIMLPVFSVGDFGNVAIARI